MRKPVLFAILAAAPIAAGAGVYDLSLSRLLVARPDGAPWSAWVQPDTVPESDVSWPEYSAPEYRYDSATRQLTSTGITHLRLTITGLPNPDPAVRLRDEYITDLAIDAVAGSGSASIYDCLDGGYRFALQASPCGQFGYGTNGIDDSVLVYGPGTAYTRAIQGDDSDQGGLRSITDYDLTQARFDPTPGTGELVLRSADWSPDGGTGMELSFTVVSRLSGEDPAAEDPPAGSATDTGDSTGAGAAPPSPTVPESEPDAAPSPTVVPSSTGTLAFADAGGGGSATGGRSAVDLWMLALLGGAATVRVRRLRRTQR